MPIKPENRARYPKEWPAIRSAVRARSGDCCEGSLDFPDCRRPNGWLLNKRTGELTDDGQTAEVWELADGDRVTKVVLTVAHLDHHPENNSMANLRHMCQRCHLNYDKHHHQQNAYTTRKAKANTLELDL